MSGLAIAIAERDSSREELNGIASVERTVSLYISKLWKLVKTSLSRAQADSQWTINPFHGLAGPLSKV